MTIAIRIGASSTVYDDLKSAYSMASAIQQKLTLVGTGEEVKNELSTLFNDADATLFGTVSKSIGSIKATNDLNLTSTDVTNYKAALVKLGTKSIVLASATDSSVIANNFNDLDAVYTKVKSITLTDANTATPTIAVDKLAGSINLAGLEKLTGKKFNVSGDVTSIKANMDTLLKNISRIDKVVLNAVTATPGSVGNSTVGAFSNTLTVSGGHGFLTGDKVRFNGTAAGAVDGTSYYARKVSNTEFQVFTNYADAVDGTSQTNKVAVTVAAGKYTSEMAVEFTAKQLTILGDKLVKADSAKVLLKDTADNLLATSSLKLINRLNNSNINTPAVVTTPSSINTGTKTITSTGGHSFNTGDEIRFTGTSAGELVTGTSYYARKTSNTEFQLFGSYAESINGTNATGIKTLAASSAGDAFTSRSGPSPFRTTTLDDIQVTRASLSQANRFTTLTALNGALNGSGAGNRLISDIVSSVEIMDTAANLTAGTATKVGTALHHATAAGKISFATLHGFKTGDAVTYNIPSTGSTVIGGLTAGTTYYLGQVGGSASDDFALFSTKAAAMNAGKNVTANLLTLALAQSAAGAIVFTNSGTGTQNFTSSNLTKTMSDVSRYGANTGTVDRVTIKGAGQITTVTLNDFARKVNAGSDSLAKSTYSAKGVDIQNNLQALYDNQTAEAATGIKEIVVSDGTAKGKKAFTISETYLNGVANNGLNKIFKEGVDQYTGNIRNKNYTFNVTNAAFANTATLQSDSNVGAFAVVGATVANLTNLATQLAAELSMSKLTTMTTVLMSSAERTQVEELLYAIGSGPDRAKLKLNSTL